MVVVLSQNNWKLTGKHWKLLRLIERQQKIVHTSSFVSMAQQMLNEL